MHIHYEHLTYILLVGEYSARQGDVGSDLCGLAGTHRVREAVIRHHTACSENVVNSDRTQLWRLSPEKVR